jgi:hypothetical protein
MRVVNGKEYASDQDALLDISRDMDDPSALVPHLRSWVEAPDTDFKWAKWIIRHPLVYSVMGPLLPHHCNSMLASKWNQLKDAWRGRDWNRVIALHERPYRMGVIEKLYFTDRITIEEMREILLRWWTDTEIPQGNQDEPLTLFREAGFSTDDPEGFDALPAILTLYRGVDGVCELTPDGPSWTTDCKVADFFAVRYDKGVTYKIQVPKASPAVLAWISGRNEKKSSLTFPILLC